MGGDPLTGIWVSACFDRKGRPLGIRFPKVTGEKGYLDMDARLVLLPAPIWWGPPKPGSACIEDAEKYGGRAHGGWPINGANGACFRCWPLERDNTCSSEVTGPLLSRIGWSTKIPLEIHNLHRKAWGLSLVKCRVCGARRLQKGSKGQGVSVTHGDRWRLGLRDICGKCMRLPAEKLAARAFAAKARGMSDLTDIQRLHELKKGGIDV